MTKSENEKQDAPFIRATILWWVLVLVILVIALVLRMRHIDTTGIWSDQSFTLNTAMRWVQGGDIPLASNKSSVGFVNPPMIEYVYAVALVFWGDVLSVAYITMLSGLAAVALTGYGVYRIFGKTAAAPIQLGLTFILSAVAINSRCT